MWRGRGTADKTVRVEGGDGAGEAVIGYSGGWGGESGGRSKEEGGAGAGWGLEGRAVEWSDDGGGEGMCAGLG